MAALRPAIVVCETGAGVSVSECIREAVILALQENRKVQFTHNDTPVTIAPAEIVEFYYQRWAKSREG